MESGGIPDSRISAARSYQTPRYEGDCQPKNGRLNQNGTINPPVAGGWCADNNTHVDDLWFQVDLVEQTLVEGVITQGVHDPTNRYLSYVMTYKVQYSMDESEWKSVTSADSKTEVGP